MLSLPTYKSLTSQRQVKAWKKRYLQRNKPVNGSHRTRHSAFAANATSEEVAEFLSRMKTRN